MGIFEYARLALGIHLLKWLGKTLSRLSKWLK